MASSRANCDSRVITEVHERVQEASNTYGEKDGKRESKTKHFFARFGKDSSTTTLLSGRTQVQNALASLPVSPCPTLHEYSSELFDC